ncbi:MAG TPA: hypothetical protein VHE79_01095, partial [Spirochaetia bacterium]
MTERRSLFSLFLVTLFGLSFETFLNRYLALALFSDYSYWVISLALLGYSFGGVVLSMAGPHFHRHSDLYQLLIPPLLLAAAILAFALLRVNPFNPLQLQNLSLWKTQIGNIFLFYAALFPVFFLTGTYIGLMFMLYSAHMPKVYAMDLLGSACGAAIILGAMFFVHPYHLPAVMLPLLLVIIVLNTTAYLRAIPPRASATVFVVSAALLGFGMYLVLSTSTVSIPDFKKLHSVLGIKGAAITGTRVSPSGAWLTVDDYTEFDDVSMTNNYGGTSMAAPPRTLGLYRDGSRVSSLLREMPTDYSYLQGSLPYFPYTIRQRPRVLLLGTNGGLKIMETAKSGAASGIALDEPGDVKRIVEERLRKIDPRFETTWGIGLRSGSAFSLLRDHSQKFDIIEMASSFLAQDSNNDWAVTTEAMETYLGALTTDGILSIPMDISEFDLYCLKMTNTIVAALARRGIGDPGAHVMAYRTAWTCQLLVSPRPFTREETAALVTWCNDRSFDTSWYPGIDPATVNVWNDLPPVSFQEGAVQVSQSAQDALMNDLVSIFTKSGPASATFFNLAPSTMDRPDFTSISRLARTKTLFARMEILPEREIGYLLNVVVLVQALVLAIVVLFLPLGAGRRALRGTPGARSLLPRVFLYFSALGFGFFFIELALIRKLSFFLESGTLSFAVVLAAMLVFSGLGSWLVGRFGERRKRALVGGLVVIAVSLLFFLFGLDPLMRAGIGLPLPLRIAIAVALVAPVSMALGRPFALGTSSLGAYSDSLVPWAWAINGAVSVLAT